VKQDTAKRAPLVLYPSPEPSEAFDSCRGSLREETGGQENMTSVVALYVSGNKPETIQESRLNCEK
jgi:hypothetical protein